MKDRRLEKDGEGMCVCEKDKRLSSHSVDLLKQNRAEREQKQPKKKLFSSFGSCSPPPRSPSLPVERARGGEKDLMISNKGDLHKPGSGSGAAAVVNGKAAAASRHSRPARQGPAPRGEAMEWSHRSSPPPRKGDAKEECCFRFMTDTERGAPTGFHPEPEIR